MITKCDWVDTVSLSQGPIADRQFEWQYKLPELQQLFLDCSRQPGMAPVDSPPLFPPHILLHFCDFADTLRNYPLLHIIHTLPKFTGKDDFALFDQLDIWAADPSGRVGSMRHGSGELVCVRLLSEFEQVKDKGWVNLSEEDYEEGIAESQEISSYELDALRPEGSDGYSPGQPFLPDDRYIISGTTTSLRYLTRDHMWRERVYKRKDPVWEVHCDYEGLSVPEKVVQAMQEIQGLEEEPWARRGVRVGKKAWRILTDWHADRLIDKEDEL